MFSYISRILCANAGAYESDTVATKSWQSCDKLAYKSVRIVSHMFGRILEHFGLKCEPFLCEEPGISHMEKGHSMNSLARGLSYVNNQISTVKTEKEWDETLAVSCHLMLLWLSWVFYLEFHTPHCYIWAKSFYINSCVLFSQIEAAQAKRASLKAQLEAKGRLVQPVPNVPSDGTSNGGSQDTTVNGDQESQTVDSSRDTKVSTPEPEKPVDPTNDDANAHVEGSASATVETADRTGDMGDKGQEEQPETFCTPINRPTTRGFRSPTPSPTSPAPTEQDDKEDTEEHRIFSAETIPASDTEVEKVVGVRPKARPVAAPLRGNDSPCPDKKGADPYGASPPSPFAPTPKDDT